MWPYKWKNLISSIVKHATAFSTCKNDEINNNIYKKTKWNDRISYDVLSGAKIYINEMA